MDLKSPFFPRWWTKLLWMLFATMRRSSLGAAPKEPTPICMKKWEPDTFKSSSTGKGHLIRGCLLVTVVELSQKVRIRSLLAIKIFIYLDNKYPGHCWKFNWHLRYSSPKAMSSASNSRGVYSPDFLMNKILASTIMIAILVYECDLNGSSEVQVALLYL